MDRKQVIRIGQIGGIAIWTLGLLGAYWAGLFARFGTPRVLVWAGFLVGGWIIIILGVPFLVTWIIKE